MRSIITRRLDTVRRRRTAMEMAGELGTAARRAIRSRVASASRIAAIRNLALHRRPSRQSHRVRTAAREERLAKSTLQTRAGVLPQEDRASGSISTAVLQAGLAARRAV